MLSERGLGLTWLPNETAEQGADGWCEFMLYYF
jgi:hypothetical protein